MAERRIRLRYGVNATLVAVVCAVALHGGLFVEEEYYGYLNLFGIHGKSFKAAKPDDDAVNVEYIPDFTPPTAEELAANDQPPKPETPPPVAAAPAPASPLPAAPELPAPEQPKEETKASAPPEQPKKSRLKSVDVQDDEHVVNKAPADAQFLSDKNRDVAEQTRAKETNLKKRTEGGDKPATAKSDNKDEQIGGPDDKIAGTEEITPESLMMKGDGAEADKKAPSPDEVAKAAEPKGSEDGDDKKEGKELAMNDAQTGQTLAPEAGGLTPGGQPKKPEDAGAAGQGGKGARGSKRGVRGMKLQLGDKDYDKIEGATAETERKVGPSRLSFKKGRFGQRWAQLKSSLENFNPEVKVGNQDALRTRADPFAHYLASMHRQIHELWGFGFLVQAGDHPEYSDPGLMTELEIAILPDGTLARVPQVVRSSGKTNFDVAAMDAVMSASPFEVPPKIIRSANGKTYMHWQFHRDEQECATFNVTPFILTTPPVDDPNETGVSANGPKMLVRGKGKGAGKAPANAEPAEVPEGDPVAAQRGALRLPNPDDPEAKRTLDAFVAAINKKDVAALVRLSNQGSARARQQGRRRAERLPVADRRARPGDRPGRARDLLGRGRAPHPRRSARRRERRRGSVRPHQGEEGDPGRDAGAREGQVPGRGGQPEVEPSGRAAGRSWRCGRGS